MTLGKHLAQTWPVKWRQADCLRAVPRRDWPSLRARPGRPHLAVRTVEIDGKRYLWRDILKARREQVKAAKQPQATLFELKEDRRPASQTTGAGRYSEPTLFKVD